MMALTHALLSLGLAALLLPLLSAYAPPEAILTVAFVGGLAPDLDLVAEHRRTLHFPLLAPLLAVAFALPAVVFSSPVLTLVALGFGAAGLHALSDVFGGSPEPEPWNPTFDHAVYNHVFGSWHRARRFVRYSGAPEDFALALVFGGISILTPGTGAFTDTVITFVLLLTALFSLLRKRLSVLPPLLSAMVPQSLRFLIPTVRVKQQDSGGSTLSIRFR